ncbi:TPA: hypothetical protein DEP96_01170 [Candidatus Uhrbacteria bacterium]|nr:hypothetical protein [Candidatus Uhrbacteria bacterium]
MPRGVGVFCLTEGDFSANLTALTRGAAVIFEGEEMYRRKMRVVLVCVAGVPKVGDTDGENDLWLRAKQVAEEVAKWSVEQQVCFVLNSRVTSRYREGVTETTVFLPHLRRALNDRFGETERFLFRATQEAESLQESLQLFREVILGLNAEYRGDVVIFCDRKRWRRVRCLGEFYIHDEVQVLPIDFGGRKYRPHNYVMRGVELLSAEAYCRSEKWRRMERRLRRVKLWFN